MPGQSKETETPGDQDTAPTTDIEGAEDQDTAPTANIDGAENQDTAPAANIEDVKSESPYAVSRMTESVIEVTAL